MNTYLIDLPEINGPVFSPFIIKNGKITDYNNLDGVECYDSLDDITRYIDTSSLPETHMVNLDEYFGRGITSLHIIELVKQGYIPYSINLYNWYCNSGSAKGLNVSEPTSLVFCYYDDSSGGHNKPYAYFAPIYPPDNYYSEDVLLKQEKNSKAGTPDHLVPPFLKEIALFGIDSEGNIFASFEESGGSIDV